MKETKTDKSKRSLKLISALIEQYEPSVLVVEDYGGKVSQRCERVGQLIEEISKLAVKKRVRVKKFSRGEVKKAFAESDATTKQEIAIAITKSFPELAPWLPRFRKTWMSEDYRMSIFDAVGLAVTYLHVKRATKTRGVNGPTHPGEKIFLTTTHSAVVR